ANSSPLAFSLAGPGLSTGSNTLPFASRGAFPSARPVAAYPTPTRGWPFAANASFCSPKTPQVACSNSVSERQRLQRKSSGTHIPGNSNVKNTGGANPYRSSGDSLQLAISATALVVVHFGILGSENGPLAGTPRHKAVIRCSGRG